MKRLWITLAAVILAGLVNAQSLSLVASRNLAGDFAGILGTGKVVDALRRAGTSALLVDLGGAMSSAESAFEHRRKGSLTVDTMNQAGYSAWFVGGRDLAWSDQLSRFLRLTEFPVLAANLHRPETGRHLFQVQPFAILRSGSTRIGMIGLAEGSRGLLSSDPVRAARYYTGLISGRSDITIIVSVSDRATNETIAALEEVDLVVGVGPRKGVEGSSAGWVVQIEEGTGVWGIDLTLSEGAVSAVVASRVDVQPVSNEEVAEAMMGWTANLEGEPVSLTTVIGRSLGGFNHALTSPLGYLTADLLQASAETDGALVRTAHFPEDFVTGDVTVADLMQTYPLPYTVGVASLKGTQLLELLDPKAGELMYYPAGVSVVYGTEGLVESRIGGKAIDPRVDYTIAVEFANGVRLGDDVSIRDTGVAIRDLLGRHLRTSSTVKGVVDGRIQRR